MTQTFSRRLVFLLLSILASLALAPQIAFAHTVQLSWTASATSGVTYNVYRQQACSGNFAQITGALTGTTYLDTASTPGETYCYEVTASLSGTESTPSNPAHTTIPVPIAQQGTPSSATAQRSCPRSGSFFSWAKCIASLSRRK